MLGTVKNYLLLLTLRNKVRTLLLCELVHSNFEENLNSGKPNERFLASYGMQQIAIKFATHDKETCASFLASFYTYVLASNIRAI